MLDVLRRKSLRPSDIWHLDEVVISIAGKKHWLWRASIRTGKAQVERAWHWCMGFGFKLLALDVQVDLLIAKSKGFAALTERL